MIASKLLKIARLVNAFVGWLNDKKNKFDFFKSLQKLA